MYVEPREVYMNPKDAAWLQGKGWSRPRSACWGFQRRKPAFPNCCGSWLFPFTQGSEALLYLMVLWRKQSRSYSCFSTTGLLLWVTVTFPDTSAIIPWASSHCPSWFNQFWRQGSLALLWSPVYKLFLLQSFPSWAQVKQVDWRGGGWTCPMCGPLRIPSLGFIPAKPRPALLIHKRISWFLSETHPEMPLTAKNNRGGRGCLFSLNSNVNTRLERNWPWVSAGLVLEKVIFLATGVLACVKAFK